MRRGPSGASGPGPAPPGPVVDEPGRTGPRHIALTGQPCAILWWQKIMLLQKRFSMDTRHFMVTKLVIASLLNSAKIDELRWHATLCERNFAQKTSRRASQADHWQVI